LVAPRNQNRSQESASINTALHKDVTTIHYVSYFSLLLFVLKVVGITALTGNHQPSVCGKLQSVAARRTNNSTEPRVHPAADNTAEAAERSRRATRRRCRRTAPRQAARCVNTGRRRHRRQPSF